jgi:hypothetical protein
LTDLSASSRHSDFDKTNVVLAGLVFLIAFVFYALTVQRSLSFWDCGEFIACAHIMGVPHPPGTPVFMLIGRLFSLVPFVEDLSYRVNYVSVVSSAFTAMFSYLLTVRLVSYFFNSRKHDRLNRIIAYVGGIVGGLFVAFSETNWSNSVEAEVYGLAMALSVAIVWLTLRYLEERGTLKGTRTMLLIMYLAALGVGVHMTVFLVVPIVAIFFVLNQQATARDYLMVCGFIIIELFLILAMADGRGGPDAFRVLSVLLGLALLAFIFRKIRWGILIAILTISSIMFSFEIYIKYLIWAGPLVLLVLALLAQKRGWQVHWKTGMAIMVVGFLGLSTHLYIPLRSLHNPRIDENNPSRGFRTFINFLDRKQYGQVSMVDRMFERRGELKNQLGRHAHMGFYSYFEEQYSRGHWDFVPFLLLGLLGMAVAIYKRQEIGIPYFTLFLICSLGLVLYMNFADGTQYNAETNDAYLEVRNRDYFFTPAFVFFGIAIGMGVSAGVWMLKNWLGKRQSGAQKSLVYASVVLALLPAIPAAKNYHPNDRSKNFIPYNYATNILDSCPPNTILFTSGDNDTFPVWCVQEVYNYRKDIRVVNLSLLNTDWYVEQMKNRYDVPISLSEQQILWYPFEIRSGIWINRPLEPFYDRPRGRRTYLTPMPYNGRIVKVQDMMVDEIVLSNRWKVPVCFSSLPYAESPLNLRDRAVLHGLIYELERQIKNPSLVDTDDGYNLYMHKYRFGGFENSEVYRDENATGVYLAVGVSALRIFDELLRQADTARAEDIAQKMLHEYPEYWQGTLSYANFYRSIGDSARGDSIEWALHDTLQAFLDSNPENLFYMQDLGLVKTELGRKQNDQNMIERGIELMWKAFELNPNNSYAFRKLVTALNQNGRFDLLQEAALMHWEYKINRSDPLLKQIMGQIPKRGAPPPPAPPSG